MKTISICRRVMSRSGGGGLASERAAGATTLERPRITEPLALRAFEAGLLPVATGHIDGPASAWVVEPRYAMELLARGVAPWRITVLHQGTRIALLDAVVRTGAAFLRAALDDVEPARSIVELSAVTTRLSVVVHSLEEATAAAARGAGDLVVDGWSDDQIGVLRDELDGAVLVERPAFPLMLNVDDARAALSRPSFKAYLDLVDAHGAVRARTDWAPGIDVPPPMPARRLSYAWPDSAWGERGSEDSLGRTPADLAGILDRSLDGAVPNRDEVERLFRARGAEVEVVAGVADTLRERRCGDTVTYVINRNINYTNQCYFRCGFCGFSRGPKSLNLRGAPYILNVHEVVHRSVEAWDRGATEVCLQGGIHPDFTGDFYVSVLSAIKERLPEMHVHGFTPLEVWQGAETLGLSVREFLTRLRDAGLGTLPGTAAEVLDDRVRLHLCPDKVRTAEWADVMLTAHELGLRSTSTLMFGHIDDPASWANHIEVLREIQRRTGGFTEFVPLPFVHMGSPIYLQGKARPGPTWDEVVLVHAVGRIALDGLINNIQASWVKLGLAGGRRLLSAGCNDLGGTLMNENISRASGAAHGQLATPEEIESAIRASGRVPARRNTVYELLDAAAV